MASRLMTLIYNEESITYKTLVINTKDPNRQIKPQQTFCSKTAFLQ